MHSSHRDTLDALVREIYVMGAVNREVQRRAVPEHAPAGLQALAVLARTDATRVSEVADRLRIDLSVASRQISALQSAGWVAREPDPATAARSDCASRTRGRPILEDTRSRMVAAYSHVLDDWSDEDVARAHRPRSSACARTSHPRRRPRRAARRPPDDRARRMTHREVLDALSGLLLGMFVAILSSTVVSTSLPRIISDLGGSQSSFTWVVTSTLLATDGQHADLGQARRPVRPQAAGPDSRC